VLGLGVRLVSCSRLSSRSQEECQGGGNSGTGWCLFSSFIPCQRHTGPHVDVSPAAALTLVSPGATTDRFIVLSKVMTFFSSPPSPYDVACPVFVVNSIKNVLLFGYHPPGWCHPGRSAPCDVTAAVFSVNTTIFPPVTCQFSLYLVL